MQLTQLTPLTIEQQRAATTTDRDICLIAGAGTGKTRVLVERFLHLVATKGVAPETILAITFTEKAAQEMQERLQAKLNRPLRGNNINTIHSCCYVWLREWREQAGLAKDARVANEFESRYLAYEALFAVVEAWQQKLPEQLQTFVEHQVWQGGNGDASYRGRLAATLLPVYDKLRSIGITGGIIPISTNGVSAKRLQQSLQQLLREIKTTLPLLNDSERVDRLREIVAALTASLEQLELKSSQQILQAIDGLQQLHLALAGRWGDDVRDLLKSSRQQVDAWLAELYQKLAEPQYELLNNFLKDFDKRYSEAKRLQGVLDYEDLQLRMLALLQNHPQVVGELRQRYQHILVDEFQDLNPLQLQLINVLRTPNQLFVVGDIRQSIYAFRYADVHNFENLQASLAENRGITMSLTKSFRSCPEILDLLNDFVAVNEKILGEGMAVGDKLHPHEQVTANLPIECRLFRGENTAASRQNEATQIARWIAEITKSNVDRPANKPVNYGDIAILFRSSASIPLFRQQLTDLQIPVEASATSGFYQTREVQDALGILKLLLNPHDDLRLAGVLKSEFVGISDATLHLLRCRQAESVEKASTLWEILQLDRTIPVGISEPDTQRLRTFTSGVAALQEHLLHESVYSLLETILLFSSVEKTLLQAWPEWQAKQKLANLEKLLQQAQQWDRQPAAVLATFLEMTDFMLAAEIKVPQADVHVSTNAVKLYTVHAAKGLEFPIVIVADMKRSAGGKSGSLICDRHGTIGMRLRLPNGESVAPSVYRRVSSDMRAAELAEEMRILYVAMSRAKEKLLLSSGVNNRLGRSWLRLLAQQFPLESHLKNPQSTDAVMVTSNSGASTLQLTII